jgi:hypothetical protein
MKATHGARIAGLLVLVLAGTACGTVYAQGGRYPNYPGSRNSRVYQDQAFSRGYEDGYRRGRDDGRGGDRYDVRGDRLYRSADGGYSGRYGSRNDWRQNYRVGFERGYNEGYREGQYDSRRYRGRRW